MENMLGNTLGTWGTYWELKGNILRTHSEPKMKKKSLPPPPNLKGKQARHLQCMLRPSHWLCMKFLFPKEFLTIFGLG